MNILHVQANGIGNTILSTPSMIAVREVFLNARYDLLINPIGFPVVENWSLFNHIYTNKNSFDASVYDYVILAEPRNDSKYQILTKKARKIIKHPGSNYYTHILRPNLISEIEINMQLAEMLGYRGDYPLPYVTVASNVEEIEKYKNKIGIHIGATDHILAEKKKWPLNRWIDLIYGIKPENVFLVGSKSEQKEVDIICDQTGAINACGRYSLPETAHIIANSKLFITTDSGPMHVAAAVGTPLISLFGGTSVEKSFSYNIPSKIRIIQPDIICGPCIYTPRYKTCRNYKCMQKIKVSDVLNAIDELFNNQRIIAIQKGKKKIVTNINNFKYLRNYLYDLFNYLGLKVIYRFIIKLKL